MFLGVGQSLTLSKPDCFFLPVGRLTWRSGFSILMVPGLQVDIFGFFLLFSLVFAFRNWRQGDSNVLEYILNLISYQR